MNLNNGDSAASSFKSSISDHNVRDQRATTNAQLNVRKPEQTYLVVILSFSRRDIRTRSLAIMSQMDSCKAELIVRNSETDISRGIWELTAKEHKNLRIGKDKPSMTDLLLFDVVETIAVKCVVVVRWKVAVAKKIFFYQS